MEEKLVSVCMPTYNHEQFVEEAINSVLGQTYQNIEFIIINNGSLDGTHDKIMKLYDKCENRFKRFEYINRENKGAMQSFKDFEQLANGHYFTLIHSDDFYVKNKIELQVNSLESHPDYVMCYGDMMEVNQNSVLTKQYPNKHCLSGGDLFEKLLFRNFITAPTVMIIKSALLDVGGVDMQYRFDDHPLWLKIAKKYKILYINEVLVYYRRHDNNASNNAEFMVDEMEKLLNNYSDEPLYKEAITRHYLYSFAQLVKAKKKELAKKYMKKAFAKSWYHPKFIKGIIRYLFI